MAMFARGAVLFVVEMIRFVRMVFGGRTGDYRDDGLRARHGARVMEYDAGLPARRINARYQEVCR